MLFLVINIQGDWQYALTRRLIVIATIVLTAAATGGATVIFQTLTHNRILTPSIIGLDSLYVLMQTVVVFMLGAASNAWTDAHRRTSACPPGFWPCLPVCCTGSCSAASNTTSTFMLAHRPHRRHAVSKFVVVLADNHRPNEFLIAQGRMFASFNNVRPHVLGYRRSRYRPRGSVRTPYFAYLDVLGAGREHAINLGVDYNRIVRRLWTGGQYCCTAVATGLGRTDYVSRASNGQRRPSNAGRLSTFGLAGGHRHHRVGNAQRRDCSGGAALCLCVPVSVIVNLAGGVYFLYLVLKESQA